MHAYFFILLIFSSLAHAKRSERPWLLHDVSVLFPIPKTLPDANAFKIETQTDRGVLLPQAVAKKIPLLDVSLKLEEQTDQLHVVGVRFDPPEIRLVWHVPLNFAREWETRQRILYLDVAVHTFYKLTPDEVPEFIKELKALSTHSDTHITSAMPLGIHPSLALEGWDGNYGKGLRALLLKWIGDKNLFKMTFMNMKAVHLDWVFGGFNVSGNKTTDLKIGKINKTGIQIFTNDSFPAVDFNGGIGPAPSGQDEFNRFVADSNKPRNNEPSRLEKAHQRARMIENPLLETTDSVDCVSCHVAQPLRYVSESKEPKLKEAELSRYTSTRYNLKVTSPVRAQTDNVRAFGYLGKEPAINQRTINESAFVADKLNNAR